MPINYFEPYKSKKPHFEDQLTRAFIVLIRYSASAFNVFYNYCNTLIQEKLRTTNKYLELKDLDELDFKNISFNCQIKDIKISSEFAISFLLTDELIESNDTVILFDRNAVFDSVIQIDDKITFIIENKPRSTNVTKQHIHIPTNAIEDNCVLVDFPIILEWKKIITYLNNLVHLKSLSGTESIIIEDFLSFIDVNFPYLNPFDKLSLCKNNQELILRRTKNILEHIVIDKSLVEYHIGWGYYIKTGMKHIEQVGLIFDDDSSGWSLSISLWFSSLVRQARAFYSQNLNLQILDQIRKDWEIKCRLTVRFRGSGLISFETTDFNFYINYWSKNIILIKRYSNKKDLYKLLNEFVIKEKFAVTEDKINNLKTIAKNMPFLDLCPTFGLIKKYNCEKAVQLDDNGDFSNYVLKDIFEGFSFTAENIGFLK